MEFLRCGLVAMMISVRLTAAVLFIWSGVSFGQFGGILWGLVELHACSLAVVNEFAKRWEDLSWRGAVFLPLLYLVGVVVPIGSPSFVGETALTVSAVLVFYTRLCLGRSFSMGGTTWLGLVDRGPYAWVRHPMLVTSCIARAVVAVDHCHLWNLFAAAVFIGACVAVVTLEESFLLTIRDYREYASRVRWRMLPGIW